MYETQKELSIKHSQLLEEVRILLKNIDPSKIIHNVDALQKLCIDHHFQEEIDSILKMLDNRITNVHDYKHDDSLYDVSCYFRIFRQEGYYVPAGER